MAADAAILLTGPVRRVLVMVAPDVPPNTGQEWFGALQNKESYEKKSFPEF